MIGEEQAGIPSTSVSLAGFCASVVAAVHVGTVVLAKEPAVHATVLLPEYPAAEHVRVQALPDSTSEFAQLEV